MTQLSQAALHKALPIVATAYGRKFGARVIVGKCPSSAYTDGKTIVVPNVPESFPKAVLWGFLGHECAHVRYTDFNAGWGRGMRKSLVNILEDARIEREIVNEYPGLYGDLMAVVQYMVDEDHFGKPENGGASEALQYYCLYHLRYRVLGQTPLDNHFRLADEALKRELPRGAQTRLKALLRKVPVLASTQEAVSLADDILNMLEEEQEKEQKKSEQQNSSGDSEDDSDDDAGADSSGDSNDDSDDDAGADSSSDSDDNSDGDAGADSSSDSDDDSDDDAGADSSGDSDDDSDDDAGADSSGDSDDDSDDDAGADSSGDSDDESDDDSDDMDADAAAKALRSILDADDDDAIEDAVTSLRQSMEQSDDGAQGPIEIPDPSMPYQGQSAIGKQLLADVRQTSNRVKAQLMGLVQASKRTSRQVKRVGRRVDHTKLHRLASGDSRLFSSRADKRSPNTAVHLLVDMSSSMSSSRQQGSQPYVIANQAAMALGLALEGIPNVNPAISFFGGNSADDAIRIGLKHGERFNSAIEARFTVTPWGCTPMAEAVWYAGYELAQTREERKLLIVLSDGGPDCDQSTHDALKLFASGGVEMIGIGIMDNAISRFIDNSVVINDLGDLRQTLFAMIQQSLTHAA